MKIAAIAGALMLSLAAAPAASAAMSGGAHPAARAHGKARCEHPAPGVTACQYPGGLSAVYYPAVDQYSWRPARHDFAVSETFYTTHARGRVAGAWSGRTISVGDGCVIDDNWTPSVTTPPANCMDSRTGGYRGATSTEQASVLAFWREVLKHVRGHGR